MFDQIFGNCLVASNLLTQEQLTEVIEAEKSIRVKLGFLAVAEKLMTSEQADEVNRLQAIMDKRFGDIAVDKGYLTEEQISQLLKKQGNIYITFVQTLIDKHYLTLDEVEEELNKYQEDQGFTHSDMDDLVSGDIDRTVKLFLPNNSEQCNKLCGLTIRTIIRLIDRGAYVSKAFLTDAFEADNFVMQEVQGDFNFCAGFAGTNSNLLAIASIFGQEDFETVDMDALDAVGEFTNCINGLYASEISRDNIKADMLPPEFYERPVKITGRQFCVFPIIINENIIHYILAVDTHITVSE